MPNQYTVAIHLKGQDELTRHLRQAEKSFESLGQTTRLNLVPMENWSRELEESARIARETAPDTLKLAGASKVLTEAYGAQENALQQMAPAIRHAAEVGLQALQAQEEQAESLSEKIPGLFEKAIEASKIYRTETRFVFDAATEGFKTFRKSTADGLENLFSVVFKGETEKFKSTWDVFTTKLGDDFLRMLSRIAAGMTQELLLKPALELGEQALAGLGPTIKALFLAEGGLVTKPTLGIIGEAGPELVIPLEAAGEFVKKTLVGAAKDQALNEAAKQAALDAGLEIGVEKAGAAAAAAASLTTGAALFVFGDAINAALGGQSAIRAIGDIAFGGRGGQGLLEKGLGALGIKAFRGKGGEFNIPSIQAAYAEALAEPPFPPFSFNELMARLGSDDIGLARAALAPYLAEGGFVTGPTLALIGERGREAVLPLDSPSSMRGLTESLRPIVRGLFEEMGLRGGPGAVGRVPVVIQLVLNGRAIQEISREVDVTNERRPRTQRAPRPAWSGV